MERNLKIALFVAAVAGGSAIIYYGTESRLGILESCDMQADFYMTAEYSEVEVFTELNTEGKLETFTETSYWTEPASVNFIAITHNGHLMQSDSGKTLSNGYFIPDMPPVMHRPGPNFDSYSEHKEFTGHAVIEGKRVTLSASKYLDCLINLDKSVQYKTFFSNPLYVIFE